MKTLLSVFSSEIFGGPHNELCKLAQNFQDDGLVLVTILPEENKFTRARFEEAGIQVKIVSSRRLKLSLLESIKYVACLPVRISKMSHALEEIKPDILQLYNFANLELIWIARKKKIPSIWKIIDSRMPSFLGKKLVSLHKKRVTQILTTGERLGSIHYGLKLKDSWSYYYPFFKAENGSNFRSREDIRAILGIPSSYFAIGMLANFNPQKRHSILIDAFSEVFKNTDNFKLILRGHINANPPYFKKIKETLDSRGFDLNTASGLESDISPSEFMKALDMHIVVSGKNSEGFPNTIVEAFSAGTFNVSTNVGSIPDLLSNFENGILLSRTFTKHQLASVFRLIKVKRIDTQLLNSKKFNSSEFEFRIEENVTNHLEIIKYALSKPR
jgi:glycosyltransferase involved in cell wall biosynthesis